MRRAVEIALLALATACVAGCSLQEYAQQREANRTESRLVAAGFRQVPADTPAKSARLDTMQPYTLGSTVRHGKSTWYYVDPTCRCAYVGSDAAYARYQQALAAASERARAEEQADPATTWGGSPESMEATEDIFSPENPDIYDAPSNW
jgi:hypothetical protein